ncbi:MAG: DNA polymerase III subunit alpha [Patescibacteria group bacterium]|nr:DNA polymerase III subunit alpha [Patescibacteria group bacterium]
MKFVHLHTHSHYSLLDGLGKIPALVSRAKELGMPALALTDHGAMYGAIEFYTTCRKEGIKPIIGVEAYVAPNRRFDKRPRIDDGAFHLVLLAETLEGYKNLLRLTSKAYLEGFYYRPRMDKEILREYSRGIIASTACLGGQIPRALMAERFEDAENLVTEYKSIFGADNFFLELQDHPELPEYEILNPRIMDLAKATGTPLIATKDIHYVYPDDRQAQDLLTCVQTGKTVNDTDRLNMANHDASMTSPEHMAEAFAHVPEAIENTVKIAERCNVEIPLGGNILPVFHVPTGESDNAYLRRLCEKGLGDRFPVAGPEIRERLEYELSTIERMGFASYFLIVSDFVNWAKDRGIMVGPGRGSAAGSIVSYVLKITDIDPLRYGLLFERFLNPDRISMPDIDLDFADDRRGEVIEYVVKKYGSDNVAGIITFGTMASRAAVRDVGRVLGWPYGEVDRIAKLIPPPIQGKHIPLVKSVKENPELRAVYEGDARVKELLDLSMKLEGTVRHASQHACGIVISDKPLTEYVPLQAVPDGDIDRVTQYSLHPIEDIGLLKMDFLGLANLTIIQNALDIIGAVYHEKIDIEKIPLDDKKAFELLGRGETTGVFQLESDGMKRYIKELKPTEMEDIIAMVALYRPGPMQWIDSFIRRKHGKERIEYEHPLMENALKNTYGIPVYQEQVMQVSKDMAGFTGGEADTLRKAMGKKIAALMKEMKDKFIKGAVKQGVARDKADKVFTRLEDFAAYGFNKSHATCYAMIAYRTAFLKARYPNCFMAALMNSDSQNIDRITIEVDECRKMGLEVLPPDVNESFGKFAIVPNTNKIRWGLSAIKNLGEDIVKTIVHERKANGNFRDLEDFISRINTKNFNKKSLESLIRSGALDLFGERNQLLQNIEILLEFHRGIQKEIESGQSSLFAGSPEVGRSRLTLRPVPAAPKRERLQWERELLGLYVTEHPFRELEEALGDAITRLSELAHRREGFVKIGGVLTTMKKILTRKNETMLFARIEDTSGDIELIIFPNTYRDFSAVWQADNTIIVSGKISDKDGEPKVIVNSACSADKENCMQALSILENGAGWAPSAASLSRAVQIEIPGSAAGETMARLKEVLLAYPGGERVRLIIGSGYAAKKIEPDIRVDYSAGLVEAVGGLLGPESIRMA